MDVLEKPVSPGNVAIRLWSDSYDWDSQNKMQLNDSREYQQGWPFGAVFLFDRMSSCAANLS